jgi:putative CocE/NonD family hydrolase
MMGISWGGFNALQVAALRPPALKAIVTVCSTDDRYGGDCHWEGGLLLNGTLAWGATAFQFAAQPPDPAIVGDRWRDMWRERLDGLELFVGEWIAHPHRDAYWKQGSVCEDYGAIEAAVYAISGWADPYTNAVPRLLSNLKCPRRGLIGPWAHNYGHIATPGPRMDFLGEITRWWDHWLKGVDTGIMNEPMATIWMQESIRPSAVIAERPGRWVTLDSWPDAARDANVFHLAGKALAAEPGDNVERSIRSPLETGLAFGEWCPYSGDGELPIDQRIDDAKSLTWESEPLQETVEFVGAPVVRLRIKSDKPLAAIAVRLCDVFPDGASSLVSYGLLNLAHRRSAETPEPLEPGHYEDVVVRLNDKAHRFLPGQAVRLSISSSFWPATWPLADPPLLTVATAGSSLALPRAAVHGRTAEFGPARSGPQAPIEMLRNAGRTRIIIHDPTIDRHCFEVVRGRGAYRIVETDTLVTREGGETYELLAGQPLSARSVAWGEWSMERSDWQPRTKSSVAIEATATTFEITAELQAFDGGKPFATRHFSRSIQRKLV